MKPPYCDKEAGWEQWLCKYGLWDDSMSGDSLYLRYLRFSKVQFEVVPEHELGRYFKDLLLLEDFFVFGNSIGYASKYSFCFQVSDSQLIRKKPTPLPLEAQQWVEHYLQAQVKWVC